MDLDEAWQWFSATKGALVSFARLGRKHWDQFPEESPLWRDDSFRSLDSRKMIEDSELGLGHLDDFAVMVFFSVFESIVRERVLDQVQDRRDGIDDELLGGIIDASLIEMNKRSFARVLEIFKSMDARLVEEVNQVRRYRNWVAHGRRSSQPEAVDPEIAYGRLSRFLKALAWD